MDELEAVLLDHYGDHGKMKKWLQGHRPITDPAAEARALRSWIRPTLDE